MQDSSYKLVWDDYLGFHITDELFVFSDPLAWRSFRNFHNCLKDKLIFEGDFVYNKTQRRTFRVQKVNKIEKKVIQLIEYDGIILPALIRFLIWGWPPIFGKK